MGIGIRIGYTDSDRVRDRVRVSARVRVWVRIRDRVRVRVGVGVRVTGGLRDDTNLKVHLYNGKKSTARCSKNKNI